MTQKEAQKKINQEVEHFIQQCNNDNESAIMEKRLRSCSAKVFETEHYYVLFSYSTNVATIDKRNGILYDYLRYVFGYTAASAQHIAKFAHDYHSQDIRRWREI